MKLKHKILKNGAKICWITFRLFNKPIDFYRKFTSWRWITQSAKLLFGIKLLIEAKLFFVPYKDQLFLNVYLDRDRYQDRFIKYI